MRFNTRTNFSTVVCSLSPYVGVTDSSMITSNSSEGNDEFGNTVLPLLELLWIVGIELLGAAFARAERSTLVWRAR